MSQGERKLTAVMFTDIVGYTTLGQENESLALEILQRHRDLLRPVFAKHRGREVKTMGDAFLVEFGSALEATLCAIDVQSSVHNLNLERGDKVQVRIGIHLGDVVHLGGDVLGDAVNIASRIEPLASPAGICISGQVYDHVKNKVSYPLVRLDAKELKNVKEQIELYRVVLPWEGKGIQITETKFLDRRRVAVLPLVSLSPDPNDEFFADGITEELISTMSNIAGLQLISRTSVMHFKKTSKSMREIANELDAGSILEGSVRKANNKVRVTVQLIDSNEDTHVWAKSYDRQLEDVFAIQSDISMSIAESLKVQLLETEKERVKKAPTKSTEANLMYLKGRYYWNERTKPGLEKAIEYFSLAVQDDPSFALAYSGLADTYSVLSDHGYMARSKVVSLARSNAERAIELDGELSEAHASLGLVLQGDDPDGSRTELKRAIVLNPNNAYAHMWYSLVALTLEERIAESEKAVGLDPLNLQINSSLGSAYYLALDHDQAIAHLVKTVEMSPEFAPAHFWLSLAYCARGLYEEAIREATIEIGLREETKAVMGSVFARAGRIEEAHRIANELESSSRYVDPVGLAWLYASLGMREKSIERLKKGIEENSGLLTYFAEDPLLSDFREDPDVKALLGRASP